MLYLLLENNTAQAPQKIIDLLNASQNEPFSRMGPQESANDYCGQRRPL